MKDPNEEFAELKRVCEQENRVREQEKTKRDQDAIVLLEQEIYDRIAQGTRFDPYLHLTMYFFRLNDYVVRRLDVIF